MAQPTAQSILEHQIRSGQLVSPRNNADGSMTFTQAGVGAVVDAVLKDYNDAGVGNITFANTTPGVTPSAEPTDATWIAIPAARKCQVDVSGDTTAADVAASFEVGLDGLTGFSSVLTTDDTAADGTMVITPATPGYYTEPVGYLFGHIHIEP